MWPFARPSPRTLGFLIAGVAAATFLSGDSDLHRPGRKQKEELDSVLAVRNAPLLQMLVPAYFLQDEANASKWKRLFDAGRRVRITAVLNVNSGPGTKKDEAFVRTIAEAKRNQVHVIGYVPTDYGNRQEQKILADIAAWYEFYPEIDGIFLDGQAKDSSKLPVYLRIRQALKTAHRSAVLISNPGLVCESPYFTESAIDTASIFEQPRDFEKFKFPDQPAWKTLARNRFAALPYNVGEPSVMKKYLTHAVKCGLGTIYVTDASGDHRWERLPDYWEEEVEAVYRINQHQAP